MAATENIDNYKDLKKEVNQINSLLQGSKTSMKLESNEFPKVDGEISKDVNGFKVEITDFEFQRLDRTDRINGINGRIADTDYIINRFSVDDRSTNLDLVNNKGRFQNICSFNELQSVDFSPNNKRKY